MTERKTGKVRWFDSKKGYGFITGQEGEDIFVHYRAIAGEGWRSLRDGQLVEYTAGKGEKGWAATEVIVLTDNGEDAFQE